jgi:hypothetical protein
MSRHGSYLGPVEWVESRDQTPSVEESSMEVTVRGKQRPGKRASKNVNLDAKYNDW